MRIAHVDIQNFRRLKNCRIEFAPHETIFVGANNSGKTSAMSALLLLLKNNKRGDITALDFTLSNWDTINRIAEKWVAPSSSTEATDLSNAVWWPLVPTLDVWLNVEERDFHHVKNIIPTLDWSGGLLGVRLVFCPDSTEQLCKDYKAAYEKARNAERPNAQTDNFKLPPKTLKEFLEQEVQNGRSNISKYFKVKFYTLDPAQISDDNPQTLSDAAEPLDADPFANLLKIDIINAQRGFNDPNTDDDPTSDVKQLSSQLRRYYEKHLDPSKATDTSDIEVLRALHNSKNVFDEKLKTSFSGAIGELEHLNYPGFSNPRIRLSSKLNLTETLTHDSSVQFDLANPSASENSTVPERYNGLGYQNLISMFFSLIRFRDEWMRVGKAGKIETSGESTIEPLHLVFIEEPEAHLHAQVQQVFIKRAYELLRNHNDLRNGSSLFSTQLIVSTHSSHIAHEVDFTCLRYFQRKADCPRDEIPSSKVKNLSSVFGNDNDTKKFATRYLRTTHCDLFFADAVILVEGPAERMLIPNFIRRKEYDKLSRSYISLLEIGGSHAHRLKPLIETLGIPTLIITDLDTIQADKPSKARPQLSLNLRTGNQTLKEWLPHKEQLDDLVSASDTDKLDSNGIVRVAYPAKQSIEFSDGNTGDAMPYTFEDALALSNLVFFRNQTNSTGLLKKIADATSKATLDDAMEDMFTALNDSPKKAAMALELVFISEPNQLVPPQYIAEGLKWLQDKLSEISAELHTAQLEGATQ